ncbi:MAG: hypothetical protein A3J83_05405 [Elusimicrobia bacterium RIFOXYA2_FULL_40_6]|nr:MAG: hypothetical protein A3J83_05405 [Elusimicrobia bacterium RIFOXYA2_FULL_40_6]
MSIKTRLFTAFGVLVVLVLSISLIFVSYTYQARMLLDKSLLLSETLTSWREISLSYERQTRNVSYFIILNDSTEKDKFDEQYDSIQAKLKKIDNSKEKEKFLLFYIKYIDMCKTMFSSSRERRFNYYEENIMPLEKQVLKDVTKTIDDYYALLNSYEATVKNVSRRNAIISISFGLIAVLVGIVLGIITFTAIWVPLTALIKGTQVIGEGNLDYRITVNPNNEMGKLALSFNKMVDNLRKLQLQVVQMDRMSSIGQLAGGVAHEINNPLTGVLGQAQLLLEKLPKDDPSALHLQRIEQAAQRCRKIVRALLDFAREKNYIYQPTNIETLINETLNFCETEMRSSNIEVSKIIPMKLPPVKVSSSHIQQVFLNIVNNSIHAMIPNGWGKLTIEVKTNNNMVDISFKDTGIGIKKDNVGHVFDPFFTTKDIGKGTGLGLTVSYGIIQKHNGEVIAKSEGEGKGAEFIIRLPI